MRLLIAIPCLNEEKSLATLIGQIPKKLNGFSERVVLVLDDGSTDNSAEVARAAGAEVISMHKNLGLGLVFRRAVDYAVANGFTAMVNIDGDGQFDPAEIEKLLQPILNNKADFVSGTRFRSGVLPPNMSKIKIYGNYMMTAFVKSLTGVDATDVSCGFRAFSREALLNLNLQGRFTYTQETFIDLSFKKVNLAEVPITVRYFKDRKSRVASNLFSYGINTFKIIVRSYRDYFPLKFFWGAATILLIPALITGAIFITHYIQTKMFYGQLWAGFTSAFLVMTSLVFIVLGIIADILVRMRINQERILYLLKSELKSDILKK